MRILIVLMLLLSSCSGSNLSRTFVSEGKFTLYNGKYDNSKWEENLVFQRKSWFYGLTLMLDLMVAPMPQNSKFRNWFAASESRTVSKCRHLGIGLIYKKIGGPLDGKPLVSELKRNKVKVFPIPEFEAQLRMHPDYENESLYMYEVYALCSNEAEANFYAVFPGYLKQEISLK